MYFDLGMPEWMDDNNDDDNHLSNATFEQDGTFTRLLSVPQNDSNEQQKTESVSDESLSQKNPVSIDFDYTFHYLFLQRFSHDRKKKSNLKNQYHRRIQLLLMFPLHPNLLVSYFFL